MKTNANIISVITINIALILLVAGVVGMVSSFGWLFATNGYGLFGTAIILLIIACGGVIIFDIVGKMIDKLHALMFPAKQQ